MALANTTRPTELAQAESIVRMALGEELYDLPIYLLATDELPTDCIDPHCLGWTSPLSDLQYEQIIRDVGLWRGRGFCAVLDVAGIHNYAEQAGIPYERKLCGVAVHEAAHFVTDHKGQHNDQRSRKQLDTKAEAIGATDFLNELLSPAYAPCANRQRLPWDKHELAFIRACAHLWWRTRSFGITPRLINFAGNFYCLTDAESYCQAFGGELLDEAPLSEILKRPPPAASQELWQRDTTR